MWDDCGLPWVVPRCLVDTCTVQSSVQFRSEAKHGGPGPPVGVAAQTRRGADDERITVFTAQRLPSALLCLEYLGAFTIQETSVCTTLQDRPPGTRLRLLS
jgi:hypothetical protein